MANDRTTGEWEAEVGRQLRLLRVREEIDQIGLARRAGVALNAVKHLESGGGATLSSLIKVLRALGREEWLNTLSPAVTVSPMQMLKTRTPRKRVRRKEQG